MKLKDLVVAGCTVLGIISPLRAEFDIRQGGEYLINEILYKETGIPLEDIIKSLDEPSAAFYGQWALRTGDAAMLSQAVLAHTLKTKLKEVAARFDELAIGGTVKTLLAIGGKDKAGNEKYVEAKLLKQAATEEGRKELQELLSSCKAETLSKAFDEVIEAHLAEYGDGTKQSQLEEKITGPAAEILGLTYFNHEFSTQGSGEVNNAMPRPAGELQDPYLPVPIAVARHMLTILLGDPQKKKPGTAARLISVQKNLYSNTAELWLSGTEKPLTTYLADENVDKTIKDTEVTLQRYIDIIDQSSKDNQHVILLESLDEVQKNYLDTFKKRTRILETQFGSSIARAQEFDDLCTYAGSDPNKLKLKTIIKASLVQMGGSRPLKTLALLHNEMTNSDKCMQLPFVLMPRSIFSKGLLSAEQREALLQKEVEMVLKKLPNEAKKIAGKAAQIKRDKERAHASMA